MGERLGFSNRVLVIIFVILSIVIVALAVAIIFVSNPVEGNQLSRQEKWDQAISCQGKDDDAECDELIAYLEEQTKEGNSIEDRVDAYRLLAMLAIPDGDNTRAIALLTEALRIDGLQDDHKLFLYKTLLDQYREVGDTSAEMSILEKIVSLPDDLRLEYEDWSKSKPYYLQKLEKLREVEANES